MSEKHFVMDPGEIVVDYRRAANKTKQIDVLANLNLCEPRDIAELLRDRGEELPKVWQTKLEKPRRGSKAEPSAPALTPPKTNPPPAPPLPPVEEVLANPKLLAPPPARRQPKPLPGKAVTVSKLLELLGDLPGETPVLLEDCAPVCGVSFVRDFDIESGGTLEDRVLLFR